MMKTKHILVALLVGFAFVSCKKINREKLSEYAAAHPVSQEWLIACAVGNEDGYRGTDTEPIEVFFYPQDETRSFRYFKTKNLEADPNDFSQYKEIKELKSEEVFNGALRKFKVDEKKEHWGIVTYLVADSLRISDPIKIQQSSRKTEKDESLVTYVADGVNPQFSWVDGTYAENVIYFQVISSLDGDLISGTYTEDKFFQFYDLSNVVINITPTFNPTLTSKQTFNFTLMSVSEDNWVNVAVNKEFNTQ